MNRKKILHEIILDLWDLLKVAQKYECEKLTDSEWEVFFNKSIEFTKKYRDKGKEFEMLFRDLFAAIQKYYQDRGK